jgi:hypothetical protein
MDIRLEMKQLCGHGNTKTGRLKRVTPVYIVDSVLEV